MLSAHITGKGWSSLLLPLLSFPQVTNRNTLWKFLVRQGACNFVFIYSGRNSDNVDDSWSYPCSCVTICSKPPTETVFDGQSDSSLTSASFQWPAQSCVVRRELSNSVARLPTHNPANCSPVVQCLSNTYICHLTFKTLMCLKVSYPKLDILFFLIRGLKRPHHELESLKKPTNSLWGKAFLSWLELLSRRRRRHKWAPCPIILVTRKANGKKRNWIGSRWGGRPMKTSPLVPLQTAWYLPRAYV